MKNQINPKALATCSQLLKVNNSDAVSKISKIIDLCEGSFGISSSNFFVRSKVERDLCEEFMASLPEDQYMDKAEINKIVIKMRCAMAAEFLSEKEWGLVLAVYHEVLREIPACIVHDVVNSFIMGEHKTAYLPKPTQIKIECDKVLAKRNKILSIMSSQISRYDKAWAKKYGKDGK